MVPVRGRVYRASSDNTKTVYKVGRVARKQRFGRDNLQVSIERYSYNRSGRWSLIEKRSLWQYSYYKSNDGSIVVDSFLDVDLGSSLDEAREWVCMKDCLH